MFYSSSRLAFISKSSFHPRGHKRVPSSQEDSEVFNQSQGETVTMRIRMIEVGS